MPLTNIIINGTFEARDFGWTGNDVEANYREKVYIGNGERDFVAEIDGNRNNTTVMEQTVTINNAQSTELTFNTALRTASLNNAGTDGFRLEVLASDGTVIASENFFPTVNTMQAESLPITFPAPGDYTIRFTELGVDDSLGAIVDDIVMMVCFEGGAQIETDQGPRAAAMLNKGDRVWTADNGYQEIQWIASREVSLAEQTRDESYRAILFRTGSLGPNLPNTDLMVSGNHRMLVTGGQVAKYFGTSQVLIPAKHLVNGTDILRAEPIQGLTYVHFMFKGHEIVQSNGVESESFYPGDNAVDSISTETRAELFRLFPELERDTATFGPTARTILKGYEARLLLQP